MSLSADEGVLVVVVATALFAARFSVDIPVWWAVGLVAASTIALRPTLVLAALIVLVAARADASIDGLTAATSRPLSAGEVEIRTDPRPTDFGWRADGRVGTDRLRIESRRIDLSGFEPGDRLIATGSVVGERPDTDWAISRRIVGTLRLAELHERRGATGPEAWASELRQLIADGARTLNSNRRSLYTGLVFGDDRNQDAITSDNFRAAGLGHLLAVSGQNVLFVLLLAMPALSRIGSLRIRLGATLIVLAAFGFLTRFEPSVSRALVMAGVVAIASARGAPMAAVRVLPIAVVGLLVVDPLLGRSLAFQLSVAATSGLIVLSPRIEARLPGPSPLSGVAAATLGAQIAVAPLLVASFGSVSLLALPANVLAAPAAAFVMMWGLTIGVVAGLAPDTVASVLHLPTSAAIWWIERVAQTAADTPVGSFRGTHLAVAFVGLGVALIGDGRGRRLGGALVAMAIVIPLLFTPALGSGRHRLTTGVELVRSESGHDVVLLDRSAGAEAVIEALRTARVGRIDLLVTARGDRGAGAVIRITADRFDVTDIWAPPGHNVPSARVAPELGGTVGPLQLDIDATGDVVVVESGQWRD